MPRIPENGAGAAEGDGSGNADNITGAQCGRKRGGKGAKGGKIAFAFPGMGCIFCRKQGETDRPKKVSLRKTKSAGEINMGAHKQDKQGKAPHQIVDLF